MNLFYVLSHPGIDSGTTPRGIFVIILNGRDKNLLFFLFDTLPKHSIGSNSSSELKRKINKLETVGIETATTITNTYQQQE